MQLLRHRHLHGDRRGVTSEVSSFVDASQATELVLGSGGGRFPEKINSGKI